METHNIDFEIPLTREQWDELGRSVDYRPDFGMLSWAPADPDVIHVAIRGDDHPDGWDDMVLPADAPRNTLRQVARFVYNDGRPYARIEPPPEPMPPAISLEAEQELQRSLERWVRGKWHELLRLSGIHYVSGSLPATEPRPPQ